MFQKNDFMKKRKLMPTRLYPISAKVPTYKTAVSVKSSATFNH